MLHEKASPTRSICNLATSSILPFWRNAVPVLSAVIALTSRPVSEHCIAMPVIVFSRSRM